MIQITISHLLQNCQNYLKKGMLANLSLIKKGGLKIKSEVGTAYH